MLLTMLYLPLLGALMPLTSIAFPTTSNTAGMSKNIQDQLFGRDQAANERLARSVTNAKSAKTDMIPTSIDPTDNTPIYTFTNSNMPPPSDIFTNVSSPGLNDAGSSVINFKWGFGPVVVDGRIDTDTLDTDLIVWIYGLKLGEFQGNLVTGVSVDLNLRFVKGEIKVYLQNKDEVWLHLLLEFSFGKKLEKDVKILTLPEMAMLNAASGKPVQGLQQGINANATGGIAAA